MSERITKDYGTHTKDELFAEIESREGEGSPNFKGISNDTKKDDLVAALTLDDEHSSAVSPYPAHIPKVESEIPAQKEQSNPPTDDKFIHGKFIHIKLNEPFALAKHDEDGYGRTRSLKNSVHFWQGTEAEFRQTFEKA